MAILSGILMFVREKCSVLRCFDLLCDYDL
jgi:hypothetical protein